jgi:hypothetical protein
MRRTEQPQHSEFEATAKSSGDKTPNGTDSTTEVHQRLHGDRTTMSIRILPKIKGDFTKRVREMGLSTCHVAEALFTAWLVGIEEKTELVHQSPTINLTLVRDVKRVRRYSVEEISEEITEVEPHCWYCKKQSIGLFRYKPHGKDYPLCTDHANTFLKNKEWSIILEKQKKIEEAPNFKNESKLANSKEAFLQ